MLKKKKRCEVSMNKFEQYIKTTPEYKDLVLQHGERLFIKHEGEYNILTMRLAHRLWVRLEAVNLVMHEYYTGSFIGIEQLAGEVSFALINGDSGAVDVPLSTNKVVLGFNFDNYTPMSSK